MSRKKQTNFPLKKWRPSFHLFTLYLPPLSAIFCCWRHLLSDSGEGGSSVIYFLSFVFCLLSFDFCHLSFVFCLLSSVFCLLSFVFCLLSYVLCLMFYVLCLMFHSEILASLNFNKNKILSLGLANNHTLKCCSGNFPT